MQNSPSLSITALSVLSKLRKLHSTPQLEFVFWISFTWLNRWAYIRGHKYNWLNAADIKESAHPLLFELTDYKSVKKEGAEETIHNLSRSLKPLKMKSVVLLFIFLAVATQTGDVLILE